MIDTWDGHLDHKLNHKSSIDPLEFRSGLAWILIKLGLNFDHVVTNNAMTHVLVLSAKLRKDQLK